MIDSLTIDAVEVALSRIRGVDNALLAVGQQLSRLGLLELGICDAAVVIKAVAVAALHHQWVEDILSADLVLLADIVVAVVGSPGACLTDIVAGVLFLRAQLALPWQAAAVGEQGVGSTIGALTWRVHVLFTALVIAAAIVGIRKYARLLAVEFAAHRHLTFRLPGAADGALIVAKEAALRLAGCHRHRLPLPIHMRAEAQRGAVHAYKASQAYLLARICHQLSGINYLATALAAHQVPKQRKQQLNQIHFKDC